MNDNLHRVIGIDLGTTYSAVAVYDKYREEARIIIDHAEGDLPTTPSVVSFIPSTGGVIVGRSAKNNMPHDPENTVIEIKREMGEEVVDKNKARDSTVLGEPVKANLGGQWYMPQEISALILMKMKAIAEQEIGEEIRDAVITVPAYFTAKQKKATEEAALLAGLYPRQLIPEPTAAAICYGVERQEPVRKVYLVYDLGGGTFDVSIIAVEESNINVIATSGDMRLGGGDFDNAITDWVLEELRENYNIDLSGNAGAKAQIKLYAEQAKILLSTSPTAMIPMGDVLSPSLQGPPSLQLTCEKFEELIDSYLTRSLTFVDTAIEAAKGNSIQREDIDAVLLVGGSSKIPRVRERLLDHFQKDEGFLRTELNPDEVVARGAALLALRFAPSPAPFDITRTVDNSLVNMDAADEFDVHLITEHTLGVAVRENRFSRIVPQGTHIPISITDDNYTNGGPTQDIEVRIYQGEGDNCYENTLIGVMHLGPMEPKPEGFHRFAVTFSLDINGLFSATVFHINENRSYQAQFDQKTVIGGHEALKTTHMKLLALYRAGIYALSPEPVSTDASFVPPSVRPAASVPQPTSPITAASSATAVMELPQTETTASTLVPEVEIIEPKVDVPDQYKSIVRRAQKQLLIRIDPELLAAFNAFVSALNEGGRDDDALLDLVGELENIYHDCRLKVT